MLLRMTLLVLLIILILPATSTSQDRVGADFTEQINSYEKKLDFIDTRIAEERWKQLTDGESDSLEFFINLRQWLLSDSTLFSLVSGQVESNNRADLRLVESLHSMVTSSFIDSDSEIRLIKDSLYKTAIAGHGRMNGSRITKERLLYYSADKAERESAFRYLHAAEDERSQQIARLIRLRNQRAKKLGYNDFLTLILRRSQFGIGELGSFLDEIEKATDESYAALTDELRRKENSTKIEYWNLTHYIGGPFRKTESYFTLDSVYLIGQLILTELGFNPLSLPVYFASPDAYSGIETEVLIVRPPFDQRVARGTNTGWLALKSYTSKLGTAVASTSVNQPREWFKRLHGNIWNEAIRSIIDRIGFTKESLEKLTSLAPSMRKSLIEADRRKRLIEIRFDLVQARFEYEIYLNPNRDFNKVYWAVYERIMMLPRHDELAPWAYGDWYRSGDHLTYGKLIADVIGAQTAEYLKTTQGYVLGNPDTRAFLVQNYFRYGSRFGWQDLLERATSEPLAIKYLLLNSIE